MLKFLQYYKQDQVNIMFRSIFDTIVGTISSMNPLTHFIRYALDKTLNEFLRKKLTLEDFKNGPLNLQNIEVNTEKINKEHLVSSPYIMHSGIIGNLKITLPPLADLSTQSIQISVSGVLIVLKPNKKFSENFKEKMLELHEMQKYQVQQKQVEGQISETGPVDFFKELLKKIIMNIKVNISNIAIKLYMNTPSQQKSTSQFYLMLRIPLIYLDKKQDKVIKKNEVQQLNFNILLPQITVHLLSQDMNTSEYKNMKYSPGDFPFKYPTASHPRTILVIGSPNLPENLVAKLPEWKKNGTINSMKFTQMGFKLTTDYKKKTKQKNLHLQIANIQIMVTPVQIKVLSRFITQIITFKKILDTIIQQLRFESSQSINLLRKKSNQSQSQSQSQNSDLFTSIMMSFSNDIPGLGIGIGLQKQSSSNRDNSSDMFKSMMKEDKSIRESIRIYNKEFGEKVKNIPGGQQTMQFQAIQFKDIVKINMQFTNLTAYVLKYATNQDYLRIWGAEINGNDQIINNKIGCDYFMFVVKKVDVLVKAKQKLTSVNVKSINIYNVKLHQNKIVSQDSYYDIGTSLDFQAQKSMERSNFSLQIAEFTMSSNAHYCVQQIVSVSQCESEAKFLGKNVMKYSLIPKLKSSQQNQDAYILYEPAVSLHLDNKQKNFKISLKVITVAANLQLILDLLNIAFPLLAYKRLADVVNFKRSELKDKQRQSLQNGSSNANKPISSKKNIFESMYEYRADVQSIQQLQSQNKNTLVIDITEMKVGFRKGQVCHKDDKGIFNSNFADLVKKQKQKMYQEQGFSKVCFCNVNQMGIYFELQNLKLQKKLSAIKVSCKLIDMGMMKITKSSIISLSSILSIKPIKSDDCIRILRENTHCEMLIVYIPELNARFSEQQIVDVADLSVDSVKIIGSLISYKDYLEREMLMLEHKSSEPQKKIRKNQDATQKQIKVYVEKVFVDLDYCSLLIEQIYVSLNQQVQQMVCCKISTIVGGVKRNKSLRLKLCSFANDQMLSRIYPEQNHKHQQKWISDANVFFEMRDSQKPHLVFKVEDRYNFFERLDKQNFSLVFKLIKRDLDLSQSRFVKKDSPETSKSKFKWSNGSSSSTLSQKFKFKQVNSAIEEEGQKKIFIIQVSKQVRISACNLLELKKYTEKVEKFANYMKRKLTEVQQRLKSQTMLLIERKHSAEIESQSIEIIAKIGSSIIVDIRPDFIRNENERIFSKTRSVLTLNLHNNLTLLINKDKNQKQIACEFSLVYYFLSSDQREIDLNPLLLKQSQHLSELGFKTILQLNKMQSKISINQNNKSLHIKIKSILGEASIETLCLVQLHFEHIVNHHIKNQMGIGLSQIYDGENFCVLQYNADTDPDLDDVIIIGAKVQDEQDLQIEDLTGALQIYQQKLNRKKNQQHSLRTRSFTFEPFKQPEISIEELSIGKIYFRISPQGDDFDFIKFHGNQSAATKRVRVKELQDLQYYVIGLVNLNIKADFMKDYGQKDSQEKNQQQKGNQFNNISLLAKIQKVQVYLSKQKNFGYSSLKCLESLSSQSAFIICNNETELCFVLEKNSQKILIKTYCLKLVIGGTTQILNTLKKLKAINSKIQKSGWRKIYDPIQKPKPNQLAPSNISQSNHSKLIKKDSKAVIQRLVIMLPESTVKLTFQYANFIKIVDEQTIHLKQLILNQQIKDTYQIKQKIRKWAKSIAKNNFGSLLSGTALNLLVKLFSQLIALNVWWLSKLLGGFLGGPQ